MALPSRGGSGADEEFEHDVAAAPHGADRAEEADEDEEVARRLLGPGAASR